MVEFHQTPCWFPVTVTRADTQMPPNLVKVSVLPLPHSLSAANTLCLKQCPSPGDFSASFTLGDFSGDRRQCELGEVSSFSKIPCSGVSRGNPLQQCLQGGILCSARVGGNPLQWYLQAKSPVLVVSRRKTPSI